MKIKRNGSEPSAKGLDDYFTGTVRIDMPFAGTEPARIGGAVVTFEPGARTAWHMHPLGQTLIVTAGCGRVQRWNGAAKKTAMTHIAFSEALNGKVVDWMEKVSDEQYVVEVSID